MGLFGTILGAATNIFGKKKDTQAKEAAAEARRLAAENERRLRQAEQERRQLQQSLQVQRMKTPGASKTPVGVWIGAGLLGLILILGLTGAFSRRRRR